MSRWHDELKEQCVLLALGLTPDLPAMEIVDHVRECPECHRLMQETHEMAGRLPESLDIVQPPTSVRQRIMSEVRATLNSDPQPEQSLESVQRHRVHEQSSTGTQAHHGHEQNATSAQQHHVIRKSLLDTGRTWTRSLALTAAMLLLLFGNGALYWRSTTQQHDLTALQTRYESDLKWLRSAEYLLITGEPPAYQATLTAPGTQAIGAEQLSGKVALYKTAQARVYLLIQAEGLLQNAEHTVWLNHNEERRRLGEFVSTPLGTGSYVYAVDASEWSVTSPTNAIIGIRDESTQQAMLTGPLVPVTPND